ncbi:MAG TPA: hypothetical protein VNU44_14490 [Bryobacteraceae bacterium]|jgi:hypothetical protein|nr:hypothetical protein [Bryobacteraceae bacterium]
MATIRVSYGCGCIRMLETPGREDPQGLLAQKAAAGTTHTTPHGCPTHEKTYHAPPIPGHEHSPGARGTDARAEEAAAADLAALVAARNLQTIAKAEPAPGAPIPIAPAAFGRVLDRAVARAKGEPVDVVTYEDGAVEVDGKVYALDEVA